MSFVLNEVKSKNGWEYSGYFILLDTGKGMNQDECETFATHGLKKATVECGVSKFGVGAKHSVFYLSDRADVITKSKDRDCVTHFFLDRAYMRENGFNFPFTEYPSDAALASMVGDEMAGRVDREEHTSNHIATNRAKSFTIVIVRLENQIAEILYKQAKQDFGKILSHFHELYYFQLHDPAGLQSSIGLFQRPAQMRKLCVSAVAYTNNDCLRDIPNIEEVDCSTKQSMQAIVQDTSVIEEHSILPVGGSRIANLFISVANQSFSCIAHIIMRSSSGRHCKE